MAKIPLCDRCLFCAHDYHIVCALHPAGVEGDSCLDFRLNPQLEGKHFKDFLGLRSQPGDEPYTNDLQMGTNGSQIVRAQQNNEPYSNPHDYLDDNEELWEPEGASYYNGELVLQPQQRWTREEQLELLSWHPLFTGKCPQCDASFSKDYTARVHWDCPECGWMDDTV